MTTASGSASRTSKRWAGTPLFLRIFLVMLASVAAVQLLNFALVVYVGPPTPRVYSMAQVVAALRRGRDTSGEILLSQEESVPRQNPDHGVRARAEIAAQMGVPLEQVRVSFGGPPPMMVRTLGMGRMAPMMPRGSPDARSQVLFGSFEVSVQQPDGHWRLARASRTGLENWRWRALLWLVVAMLVVAPFAWALARRLAKPIAIFAGAAERLGRDPRAAPVPIDGPAEIAEAAAAFNRMQARLNRYVEDRTTMMAAIAHDLRTPLMRLGLRLERAPEAIRAASAADIHDMQVMITAGLAFFRDATQAADRRRLDLRSLVESVTDDLTDHGEKVVLQDGDALVMEGDATGLKALLSNLIGNALKYAGDAEVTLARVDGHAVIEVRDHGPGIDPDDLEHVFEPFFRGERSRNRDTGGVGLGLASVRGVARAHGGDATIINHPDGGALATVTLPV
ncbi:MULTISPECIES: HAMP domain-containing sensor histidine kinase [unclassified Sphingomonas]|uniref:sensor histidine kinase n=1 Tax=unclassified Sphingomonas TaxID=196159 RepID=UPI00226A6992|nr:MULTISPECIES: HAMP domain-containing sensor histidine kinase [unclassified Sphingomonas]